MYWVKDSMHQGEKTNFSFKYSLVMRDISFWLLESHLYQLMSCRNLTSVKLHRVSRKITEDIRFCLQSKVVIQEKAHTRV